MDGDGDLDLAGLFGGNELKWAANMDGQGTLAPFATAFALAQIDHQILMDVNTDGDPDLIYVGSGDSLWIAMGTGGAQFDAPLFLAALEGPVAAITMGNISGDELPEIVISSMENGISLITIVPNLDGIFDPPYQLPVLIDGAPPTVLLTGDLDNNGGGDILFVTENMTGKALMNVNGDGSEWQELVLFNQFINPFIDPKLIDVDADGDLDLAEAAPMVIQWAENRIDEQIPFNTFTVRQIEPMSTAGIGDLALLGCDSAASLVFVPSNPQLPVRWTSFLVALDDFAPRKDLTDIPRGYRLLLADMDGDDRPDILIADQNGIRLHRNQIVPPTTVVQLPAMDTVCLAGPSIPLPEASPSGGTWSGTWVTNNIFHRSSVGTTANVPLGYSVYEPEGCPVGDRTHMRVISGPSIIPFLGPVVCSGDGPIEMSSLPANTTWTGLSDGNILDLDEYDGEQISAAYTDQTGVTCVSFMGPLNIWNSVPAEIAPAGPFCINDGVQTILPQENWASTMWSGDISGTSGEGALFDPSQGAGTYTVILQRSPIAPQQCANSDTLLITVSDEIPQLEVTEPPAYCASTSAITLDMVQPAGGQWSGPGVSGNVLLPFIAGPGEHVLSYTIEDPGGCSNTAEVELTLASTVSIAQENGEDLFFCENDEEVQLIAQPAGGEWSGAVTAEGAFDPGAAGTGDHPVAYVYTDPNGCMLTNPPVQLVVQPLTPVSIDATGPVCLEGGPIEITGTPGGIWSGSVTGEGTSVIFDPLSVGLGTWPVSLTAEAEGSCINTMTAQIVVEICTGVDPINGLTGISVAPNPTTGLIRIDLELDGPIAINLHDAAGRVIHAQRTIAAGTTSIPLDLSAFASGTYLLSIEHDGGIVRSKVIKE